jgi:EpsI family protein
MILTMVLMSYMGNGEDIQPNKPLSTFPVEIGDWLGQETRFDQEIYDAVGVDDSFLCNYQSSDGRQVQLYIGFYQSQREGDLIHSPKNCMPGGGWNIVRTSIEELTMPDSNPENIKLIKLDLQKGDQRQIVLYWFQSRGRFISSEYLQKIYLVIDSITKHRTDGSFVRLISTVRNGHEEKTLKELKDFAKLLIPVLQEYLPS